MAYREAWALQKRLVDDRVAGRVSDTMLLVEHPPTVTLGRGSKDGDLLFDPEALAARDVECVSIERGGRATFHGPGQLVGYPIVALREVGLSPVSFLRRLEDGLVDALAELGVAASRVPGLTGVWVARDKIAAMGIAVSRGVTYHGFALNVKDALDGFASIVPCGIPVSEHGVTSIERVFGRRVEVDDVSPIVARHVCESLTKVPA
ncbi:MAG: lipoyl(octanoyl) transferase LipB [Planctomycetes bacterium]|nr:lipoyl(octanoyl) transferase LipB [Planctomycetota bacterium]MBI3844774.1 lipoyl(octanoyl) transferase LipB [Planctomycetota bacterium]